MLEIGADTERIVRCPYIPSEFEIPTENFGQKVIEGILGNSGVAVVDVSTGRQVTGSELLTQASRLGASLTSLGCRSGDVIEIFGQNSIEWIQILVSILYIDAIPAGINHLLQEDELAIHLKTCCPCVLFCDQSLASIAIAAVKKLEHNTVKHMVVIGGYKDCLKLENLMLENSEHSNIISSLSTKKPKRNKKDAAMIFFSSGTTGIQKPVLISHQAILLQCQVAKDPNTKFVFDNPVVFAPMSHCAGLVFILTELINGGKILMMPRYDLQLFVDTVAKYKVRDLFVVPPVATQLAKSPLADNTKMQLDSLLIGAASLGKELEMQLYDKFSGIKIRQLYGLTETCALCTCVPAERNRKCKEGSIGYPIHNTEIKVADLSTGLSLGPNTSGEICVRNPLIMLGYIGNNKATEDMIDKQGWLHTGDVGHYDEDGYFYVTDRIKELIKYNAYQVAPTELESVLLSHPDVADAAVVGVPHTDHGEIPLALVVLKPNASVSESQIEAFVNRKVAAHKKLRGGVKFATSIPRTGSGKILRREIKAQLLKTKL